MKVIPETRRVH